MAGDAHERLIRDETDVPEVTEVERMPVDWAFDPERLKEMSDEERLNYEIELAEKIRRLQAAQEALALILTQAGIRYEGESPRTAIDKIHNPDKYL